MISYASLNLACQAAPNGLASVFRYFPDDLR